MGYLLVSEPFFRYFCSNLDGYVGPLQFPFGPMRFEESSPGVTLHSEFIFWELHGTFPISTVAELNLP
jgi:hypothetical protein